MQTPVGTQSWLRIIMLQGGAEIILGFASFSARVHWVITMTYLILFQIIQNKLQYHRHSLNAMTSLGLFICVFDWLIDWNICIMVQVTWQIGNQQNINRQLDNNHMAEKVLVLPQTLDYTISWSQIRWGQVMSQNHGIFYDLQTSQRLNIVDVWLYFCLISYKARSWKITYLYCYLTTVMSLLKI